MKKIIVSIAVLALFASTAYAAPIIKAVKSWEFIAQIETLNKGNQFIYKVVDGSNTCYVLVSDEAKWGVSPTMSCVVNPVPVVK